ncbi:hypothetical protein [Megasphaera vaginalis (ex Bordigoni et al. 2020)]|uniref:hypothetical protein n=1 Tax=Megasphaera vaginalis (ex Bordigoni et al. 2020) TaxID=2045301 RepID=UPI0013565B5F|nr:hypothetical protein [Megasphaera vaginalis (ex Bordigoni et al. 2020)]
MLTDHFEAAAAGRLPVCTVIGIKWLLRQSIGWYHGDWRLRPLRGEDVFCLC